MKQKCTHSMGRQQAIISVLKLAGICCLLGLSFASPKILSAEPENLPPADTQLAFVRGAQIYLINADGTGLIQLTDTEPGVENRDPAWSRDGQRLAFARGENIYIMDADGSNVIQLTHGGGVLPTWGPGDREIAFIDTLGLSVIDVGTDGSAESSRLLYNLGAILDEPAWSPDGRTITFDSDWRAGGLMVDIWAMNEGATYGLIIGPKAMVGPSGWINGHVSYYQSAWSPDGQSIGIATVACPRTFDDCYDPASAIAVANADGSGLRNIVQLGGFYVNPTWSPDGGWIAYALLLCPNCESSIWYVQVDGNFEGLLTDDGHSPAWRPYPDIQTVPDDPEGPIKEPDEPAPDEPEPVEPKKPPPLKLPECGVKCDTKGELTGADYPDEQ